MKHQLVRASVSLFVSLLLVGAFGATGFAKVSDGYRDIKLGMSKTQVLNLLQKAPGHFSYDDTGIEIGEIIRSDDLFRHATYRFGSDDILVEIDLEMREVLGRDKVLELYGDQLGIKLSSAKATVAADMVIEVKDNIVTLRKHTEGRTKSAKKSGN